LSESYRPRLSIELTQQQFDELQRLLPWGMKNQLYSIITDDVIELANKLGAQFIAAILARQIKLQDYVQGLPKKED
jgi:hypothetical protein